MIIKTKRTRFRFVFDVLLIILGWVIFVVIFASGIVAMWRDEIGVPDVPFLPSAVSENMMTVFGYILLMGCFSIWLIIWAKYNQHRFAGVDRRKPPAPLVADQLLASFGVSEEQLGLMQTSRCLVVTHDQDGAIQTINKADEEKSCPQTLFFSPQFIVHYVPDTSWAKQYNAYNASL